MNWVRVYIKIVSGNKKTAVIELKYLSNNACCVSSWRILHGPLCVLSVCLTRHWNLRGRVAIVTYDKQCFMFRDNSRRVRNNFSLLVSTLARQRLSGGKRKVLYYVVVLEFKQIQNVYYLIVLLTSVICIRNCT